MSLFPYGSGLIYWTLLCVLGLSAGSFINVVVYRLPLMMRQRSSHRFNLCYPRSFCPHCHRNLKFCENIPLFSWLWMRGHCGGCGTVIPWRYPAIESLTLLTTLVTAYCLPVTPLLIAALVLSWLLLALTLIDGLHFLLPDSLTIPLLWAGLLCHLTGVLPSGSLEQGVAGAVLGYMTFWLLAWGYQALCGKAGLGRGDAKLLAAGGAWLGWQALPLLLLMASSLGICAFVMARLIVKRSLSARLPFGPALAIAIWLLFLCQNA